MIESAVGFSVLLVFIFARVPIAFAMALVGTVGFAYLRSWEASYSMVGTIALDKGLSYTLSVIPLFVLMGNLVNASGISQSLYAVAYRILGRTRGGLAMASVIACGGFSAVCGSSLATAVTMSKVAMPSMRRFGYSESLATGSIAAGGTLGILIPPSVVLIIYGLLTETDIGKLFIAGVIPGLLGLVCYIGAIAVVIRLRPSLAPNVAEDTHLSAQDIFGAFAIVSLFSVVMVGIYGGFFTPTEAAAVGAATAFFIAIGMRRLTFTKFVSACLECGRTTAMIFSIIIGAEIFSNFINFAGLPDALVIWTSSLELHAFAVILCIVLIYLLLGCVLESLSMILLTVPIFFPIVSQLDFGVSSLAEPEAILIWFAIVVVVVTEISLISPPIGLNVFVLRNALPEVPLSTIFYGVIPFWIADILRLALLILIPGISLWLTGVMS